MICLSLLAGGASGAPGALTTIENRQGGKIVYGQVPGVTTEASAMGAVLRSLHDQFGDRPNVGIRTAPSGTRQPMRW